MPNYTSPSPANVAINGNQTTWWIPAKNNSSVLATNVSVTITVTPALGLQLLTFQPEVGSFNPNTGIWYIGNLQPGQANMKWLKLVTSVADIGLAPFTITSVISGDGIDPNALNNTLVQTVTSVVTAATAGANDDPNSCSCVDVSVNDVACNYGTTTYVLSVPSITNCSEYSWDPAAGQGKFIHEDPADDITFEYSIWCDDGSGAVEISGPALVTIDKLFSDINTFNHTINTVQYSDLSANDILVLSAQYPAVDLTAFCWRVLRNAAGEATSGEPVECNESIDTRTFFVCSEVECTTPEDPCPCPTNELPIDVESQLPEGYEPETGDTIVIYHPTAMSVWTFDGTLWNKWSCGCLSMSAAIEVADTCSINMSLTGSGTYVDPFVISAEYIDGEPTPMYESGTAGSTGNTLDVSDLFGAACPEGCTASYSLNGYPTDVYENVTLVGTTLTYDIKAGAPSGTHDINVTRECSPAVL